MDPFVGDDATMLALRLRKREVTAVELIDVVIARIAASSSPASSLASSANARTVSRYRYRCPEEVGSASMSDFLHRLPRASTMVRSFISNDWPTLTAAASSKSPAKTDSRRNTACSVSSNWS